MKVIIASEPEKAVKLTWQNDFEKAVNCIQPECNGMARLGFVAHEFGTKPKSGKFLCNLGVDIVGKGLWLHDACSVAVYFCDKCLEPTAKFNQA